MARNVRQSQGEPHGRLTRISGEMIEMLESHPDGENVKAIVLLDDFVEGCGGTGVCGYEKAGEVVMRLLEHAEAVAKANDIPFAVAEVPGMGAQG